MDSVMTIDNVIDYFKAENDSEIEKTETLTSKKEEDNVDSIRNLNLETEEIEEEVEDVNSEAEEEEVENSETEIKEQVEDDGSKVERKETEVEMDVDKVEAVDKEQLGLEEELVENSSHQNDNEKGGEKMSKQEFEKIQCGCAEKQQVDGEATVEFCCTQVVPGNLEIVDAVGDPIDEILADNLQITFEPKLECCIKAGMLDCPQGGGQVPVDELRLIGCIQYAIGTTIGVISGPQDRPVDVGVVPAGCKSTVCVNELICCNERDTLTCPDALDFSQIAVNFNNAEVVECPEGVDEPDKKIIRFTGNFVFPPAIVGGCPII
ncbi:hypothetical protein [Sporohalobacter salinus]|uniref:hypothetical protein n=1 Tax=Sporohalobacter salinus TaxID=1494606 RepID=UPI00196222D7|nr:hypothetical protein [Sporohalobacter salinus]MBM7623911.1 hypothetical protein [Sporohalobacter salinus]